MANGPSTAPVLIIGAGPCGLAIAQGLRKNGIPAIVFEKHDGLEQRNSRSWAFALGWSVPAFRSLVPDELWARVDTAFIDPQMPVLEKDDVPVVIGTTGELLHYLPLPKAYRFYRPRLRALLADGVDIRFGKALDSISYEGDSVTAHFKDGDSAAGRLLVGADGARSCTRTCLLGPERAALTRLDFGTTFVYTRYTREQALHLRTAWHPLTNGVVHPAGRTCVFITVDAADADRPESWLFMIYMSWRRPATMDGILARMTARDHLQQVKQLARSFCEPMRSACEWLDDGLESVYFVPMTDFHPAEPEHAWDNHDGRVTLVGDAAHAMVYQRGQGLNHAIDDAGKLVQLLARPGGRTQRELVDAYEAEMRPRAAKEVELCRVNSAMLHDWKMIMNSPLFKKGVEKDGSPKKQEGAAKKQEETAEKQEEGAAKQEETAKNQEEEAAKN